MSKTLNDNKPNDNKISLIIVESPAKCKTIEKILGSNYKCIATCGHLCQLSSLQDIDITNNFNPTYSLKEDKTKIIESIRKEISLADEVIISSDSDREGEMIGFSIIELFKLPLNTKRITFNEITETALKYAINNPRTIDMNLVYAQQARQILDVIVGFKVSPVLWNKISKSKGKNNSLSAGRCQSPALKLVHENQTDINESAGKMVYNTTGYFTNSNLPFNLSNQMESEIDAIDFLNKSVVFSHIYTCKKPVKVFKQPPSPFTTSRLQQVASNELHYSPKETMRICQLLYEKGYITYMRTDSNKYSLEFMETVKTYITKTYTDGEKYMSETIINSSVEEINLMNNKAIAKAESSKKADAKAKPIKKDKSSKKDKSNQINKIVAPLPQEAHEAIRPTKLFLSLQELPEGLDTKEKRMYNLIWTNTLESCMVAATYHSVTANITAPINQTYSYTTELIDFAGWQIVENKFSRENKEYHYLQTLKQESIIPYKKIKSNVTIKGSKLHYTEARLVQLLEENGIGRPSTFSSIIDKIQERGYVKKEDIKGKEFLCKEFELKDGEIVEIENKREFGNEKGKLVIQPLGVIVMDFLNKNFNALFRYEYTNLMEASLDKIANGNLLWYEVCASCNKEVDELIDNIKYEPKMEYPIDDNHTYIIGKYGPVIKCVTQKEVVKEAKEKKGAKEKKEKKGAKGLKEITFKSAKKNLDIEKLKNGEYELKDVMESEETLEKNIKETDEKNIKDETSNKQNVLGQYDGKDIILHKGKFGLYALCGDKTHNLKEFGNRPIENITLEEVTQILDKGPTMIREINSFLSIRKGPKGDYLFYKNSKMKKPSFHDIKSFSIETKEDYKICELTILKSWITTKYNIKN